MIYIPISVGELIDKVSILHVKIKKIDNFEKLSLIKKEFDLLNDISIQFLDSIEIKNLYDKLCEINEKLWDVEDRLRVLESEKKFEGDFIDLSRKVYFTNDERFRLKNEINLITDSEIREVKEYVKYN
jgi:hypothetical protein